MRVWGVRRALRRAELALQADGPRPRPRALTGAREALALTGRELSHPDMPPELVGPVLEQAQDVVRHLDQERERRAAGPGSAGAWQAMLPPDSGLLLQLWHAVRRAPLAHEPPAPEAAWQLPGLLTELLACPAFPLEAARASLHRWTHTWWGQRGAYTRARWEAERRGMARHPDVFSLPGFAEEWERCGFADLPQLWQRPDVTTGVRNRLVRRCLERADGGRTDERSSTLAGLTALVHAGTDLSARALVAVLRSERRVAGSAGPSPSGYGAYGRRAIPRADQPVANALWARLRRLEPGPTGRAGREPTDQDLLVARLILRLEPFGHAHAPWHWSTVVGCLGLGPLSPGLVRDLMEAARRWQVPDLAQHVPALLRRVDLARPGGRQLCAHLLGSPDRAVRLAALQALAGRAPAPRLVDAGSSPTPSSGAPSGAPSARGFGVPRPAPSG